MSRLRSKEGEERSKEKEGEQTGDSAIILRGASSGVFEVAGSSLGRGATQGDGKRPSHTASGVQA